MPRRGRKASTPGYGAWADMIQRCTNPNIAYYYRYGGRGIKVCDRWRDFDNFLEDMGVKPKGMSLGRIDNDGDYEPSNVRWENNEQQSNNKSTNVLITHNGETLTITQWSKRANINPKTFRTRLSRGWPIEQVLSTPTFKPGDRRWQAHSYSQLT